MAVHTFSSRTRDDQLVQKVKDKCDKRGVMFSRVLIELIREWDKADEARDTNQTV